MPITVFSFGRRHLLTFNSLGDTVRKRIDGWGVLRHENEGTVHSQKEYGEGHLKCRIFLDLQKSNSNIFVLNSEEI